MGKTAVVRFADPRLEETVKKLVQQQKSTSAKINSETTEQLLQCALQKNISAGASSSPSHLPFGLFGKTLPRVIARDTADESLVPKLMVEAPKFS